MIQHEGKFLLPSRVIRSARSGIMKAYLSEVKLPTDEELKAILEILGYLALGSRILFDGSIPKDLREATADPSKKNRSQIVSQGFDLNVEPLTKPDSDDPALQFDASLSINLAFDYLRNALNSIRPIGSNIDPILVTAFFNAVKLIKEEKDPETRKKIACKGYENDIMGGKLLIGITGAECDELIEILANMPESLKSDAISISTTYFRSFFLSMTASRNGALYSALPLQIEILEG